MRPGRCRLGTRVRAVVDLAEPPRVHVRVDLRCRERRMAQQLLDRPEVGAALEQVRCERVAEAMWVRDESAQRARVEPLSGGREEQGVIRAARESGPGVVEVARYPVRRLLAERDDAILAALTAADVHELLLEVDDSEIEPDRLGAAKTGRVHELDECTVTQRERAFALEGSELLVDCVAAGSIGQPAAGPGAKPGVGHARRAG